MSAPRRDDATTVRPGPWRAGAGLALLLALSACGAASGHGSTTSGGGASVHPTSTTTGGSPPVTPGRSATPSQAGTSPARVTAVLVADRLPAPVSRPVALADGTGVLVAGGLTAAGTTTATVLRIDLTTGRASTVGTLARPVHDAAGAVLGGRPLLFGGGTSTLTSDVQAVAPGAGVRVVGHLPRPRADLVATTSGANAYVLGGYDGSVALATVLRTADGTTFVPFATLSLTVRYPAVAVSDGALWVFGGEHDGTATAVVQRVDLATGATTVAGHLPSPLAHAGAFTLGGSVFIAGGRHGSSATAEVLRFDPTGRRFSAAGSLPGPRSDFGVAVSGETAYLIGGEDPRTLASVVAVTPAQGRG